MKTATTEISLKNGIGRVWKSRNEWCWAHHDGSESSGHKSWKEAMAELEAYDEEIGTPQESDEPQA